ncbi:Piso0_003316 [Millerozyma farinosa CBS 7064]|uniref:Piso0_003316 protein n=1 Tax=Pichia sorbitophila (strain ATCC MYA-4447 / BCRC 22081 / CBS 7064 / NBRC 10061 / NRRL Y-12695) TaxID=559304 RepID=G8YIR9_PICSO|nr:Piso0_003316 [Millerozyma farinosa CBS 7064]CCE80979.1 Piso0_003316 [Millerozyma farinosa CBS 7064]
MHSSSKLYESRWRGQMFLHHYFRLSPPKRYFSYCIHEDQRQVSFCECDFVDFYSCWHQLSFSSALVLAMPSRKACTRGLCVSRIYIFLEREKPKRARIDSMQGRARHLSF